MFYYLGRKIWFSPGREKFEDLATSRETAPVNFYTSKFLDTFSGAG